MTDPLQELLADLRSPDAAIRFSVLSRIEGMSWGAEQVAALRSFLAGEADPGTSFHLQKIVARLEKGKTPSKAVEIEAILDASPRDDLALALALESVPKAEAPFVVSALREACWQSFPSEVLPFALSFLKKHGSFEDAEAITMLCRHGDPRVLSAAVEALEKLAPDNLQSLIVPLLVSPIHGIRSRAVRLLYRWDKDEAIRHFEALLFSDDANDRQAALFHAFFFPFPEIEPLMLHFLGIEDDPGVLAKAGLLFRSNPSVEELWRLLEIMEASRGEKRALVGEILTGVIRSLSEAGLVDKSPEEIMARLQAAYRERKGRQIVEQTQLELANPDAATRRVAIQRLIELHRRGIAAALAALQQHGPNEKDDANRSLLTPLLGTAVAATVEAPKPQAMTPDQFVKLDRAKRLELLGGLTKEQYVVIRSSLGAAIKQADAEERQEILRTMARLGTATDAETVEPCLRDGEPLVVVAAIEALTTLDSDRLFPVLPKLLKDNSDEVRATAVRVFALFDKKQALALVDQMFLAPQPRQRALGIFCAAQFDFPSVRDMLLKNLDRERDPGNLEQILLVFRNNPDEALFVALTQIHKKSGGDHRDMVVRVATDVGNAVIEAKTTPHKTLAELTDAAEAKLKAEDDRKRTEQPSYSLSNIKKMREGQQGKPSGKPGTPGASVAPAAEESVGSFALKAFGGGFVVTLLIFFVFIMPRSNTTNPTQNPVVDAPTQPGSDVPVGEVELEGRIQYVDPTGMGFQVRPKGSRPYYIVFRDPQPTDRWRRGEKFKGKVRVTGQQRENILAELVTVH